MHHLEKIAIIDFGSQYTQLIARRIREMGIYAEIYPPEITTKELQENSTKGVILSGSPRSSESADFILDESLFESRIPLLGICFGMHLINQVHNGTAHHLGRGEYGKQMIQLERECPLFEKIDKKQTVWMSHGDSINSLAESFLITAKSEDGLVAAIRHKTRPHYAVQFHPEVTHSENGIQILQNFVNLCACKKEWNRSHQIEAIKENIRNQVGDASVVSLVSGGVDSTLATLLCAEALGSEKVKPLHVDTGLMRWRESEQVLEMLHEHGMKNIQFIDASEQFLEALKGVKDPEEKRKRIGDLFIHLLDEQLEGDPDAFFCQGTLYTDLIESGKGCGKSAVKIKTHHNVNPPVVQKKRERGLIVEPNALLFKDEVRYLCEELGVPEVLAWRHPFPGPGLAIRILGEVALKRLETLRLADKIYIEEIEKAGLYRKIWQAFTVLLPVTSIGVMGDQRTEGEVIALRAVDSSDGMTASCHPLPYELLEKVSSRIVNEVEGINRVVYDITAKPPGTIEWE